MRGTFSRILIAVALLVLLVAACDSGADPQQTTTGIGSPETTVVDGETTTTTLAEGDSATESGQSEMMPVVTASEGIDDEVIDRLSGQIADLIAVTEEVRGLPFLTRPTVTILSPDELEARVRADLAEELVSEELAVDGRLLTLLGLLEPGDDLEEILVDLYGSQVAGFYDGETGEMVIGGEAADLTPYTKSVIVHELIHALTDQHFLFWDEYSTIWDEERYEEGSAFQALIEGDATYFQFIYIQQLPLAEQLAMATEALALYQASSSVEVPDWMLTDLAFPYESGQYFVETLVNAGGIAAVDAAYSDRPVSTEVVMHPSRYSGGERVLEVPAVDIVVDGYEVHETASYGEWGLRVLLDETAAPGVAAQAANGWGGDSYQVLYDEDDIIFALAYKGDSEDEAFELADALITMVGEGLALGEGVADGGGISFAPEDGRFAYLDRIGDGFIFVLATDATAGSSAVAQMRVP
jgi:hypothetical protein